MKTIRLGFAVLLIAGLVQADEKFEIISYFPDTGGVRINSSAGKTNRLFSSFSTEEQRHITGWKADQEFENSGLNVTFEKKTTTRKTQLGEVDDVRYVITAGNSSAVDFRDVTISYRIFYETQDGVIGTEKVKRSAVEQRRIDLSSGQFLTNETQIVSIRDESKTGGSAGYERSGTDYSFTINTPGGSQFISGSTPSTSVGGGPPTVYHKDRLIGMYLCVSKKGQNGNEIERKFEDGHVPEKEAWSDYLLLAPKLESTATSATKVSATKKSIKDWSKEDVARYTRSAKSGSHKSAYFLVRYYRSQKDQEKERQWAEKTRELIARLPAEDAGGKNTLALLNRLEETTPQE